MAIRVQTFGKFGISFLAAFTFLFVTASGPGPWAVDKKPLADRHKDKGFDCAVCHKEPPPAKVTAQSCLVCHGDEAKLAARTKDKNPNPHGLSPLNCENCHSGHK